MHLEIRYSAMPQMAHSECPDAASVVHQALYTKRKPNWTVDNLKRFSKLCLYELHCTMKEANLASQKSCLKKDLGKMRNVEHRAFTKCS